MTVESRTNKIQQSLSEQINICKSYWYLCGGLGMVIIGTFLGWFIAVTLQIPTYELKDGISLFALLFIMAQALERFMEPFTEFLPGPKKPDEAAIEADPKKKYEAKEVEQQRAIFIWGFSSFLAMVASAFLGVFLLHTIGVTSTPLPVDIVITGLVVGAGTKPLHDLIKRIEGGKTA